MEPMHSIPASGHLSIRLSSLLILIGLFLNACTPSPAAVQPEPPPPELPPTQAVAQPVDTATPEPEPDAGRIILVMDALQPQVRNYLETFADEHSMELEVAAPVQPQDIQDNWQVVVLLPAPENIRELVESAPAVQFVVSSEIDLSPANNLSVIRSRPEHLAFAAGFTGMVITPDWRFAGLLPGDTALEDGLADAFRNGGYYYCGLCRTVFAPFVRWPLTGTLPTGSSDEAWQAVVAELEPSIVYGMYIDPRAGTVDLLNWLSNKNLVLVGGATPPADVLPKWAVTIRPQVLSGLTEMMPGVLAGSGGQVVNAALELTDINEGLLSPGRQRLIEAMLEDLASGAIEPFTLPME
jgi:hypothetical protein